MKLLIVDDDENIVKLLRLFLREKGFEVIECGNGDEALRIIMHEKPDLALIDGLIPGMHGFELCKKIKEDPGIEKRPKIIIMSSVYKGLKYKYETKGQYHADEYLQKPFKKEELLAKIEALTASK
jgi:DNA-binding response OmpR family regulator